MGLEIQEMLLEQKTKYQDLKVFQSKTWGRVLVLDGVIQLTEKDEMSYQEMLAHIPMFSHQNPKRVLIVGGGDGGILREVCKHKCVEEIIQCEIDEGVVEASKKFFPNISKSFQDARLKLIIGDAVNYVIEEAIDESFDVIIVDSSDPDGPAEKLFSEEFYKNASRILTKGIKFQILFTIKSFLNYISKLRQKCFHYLVYIVRNYRWGDGNTR